MNYLLFATEAPNQIFLPGDINEFYWGSAAFLLVMIFMWWKVRPPVKRLIANSKKKIETDLEEAQKVADTAEQELVEARSMLGDMSAERERILAEARATAEDLSTDVKTRADKEVEELRRRAEMDEQLARIQTESDLRQLVTEQALQATEGVIKDSLTPALQAKLVDSYIDANLGAK